MSIWDYFTPEAGQRRRQWLNKQAEGLLEYVPPEMRPWLMIADELNPITSMERAGEASTRMVAPGMSGWDRMAAAGDMLSNVAGVVAPAVAAKAAGLPVANAVEEVLTGYAPMVQPFMWDEYGGIRAFHGSPHDFDRFDMSKIGTGEGAQAYGHGLYFAEAEDVAKAYRDALAPGMGDGALRAIGISDGDLRAMRQFTQSSVDPDIALRDWLGWTGKRETPELRAAFMQEWNGRNPGRMYEVQINANPDDFLDWDRPLSEQSAKVQEVLSQFGLKHDAAASRDFDNALLAALFDDATDPLPKRPINPTGNEIYMRSALRKFAVQDEAGKWGPGAGTYEESLAAVGGDPKRVRTINTGGASDRSEALRRAGIPGIRYLDAGSRGAGDGSRNYVVFDDQLISIIRKYGIAGAAALYGVSAADIKAAMAQEQPRGLLNQ